MAIKKTKPAILKTLIMNVSTCSRLITPSPHYTNIPSFRYTTTSLLQHSITPMLHYSNLAYSSSLAIHRK